MGNYLIIGLGSMGKRRIRCLNALGIESENIYGYDIRHDRREEARTIYGVNTVDCLDKIEFDTIKAVIVSLPPDRHFLGAETAFLHNKPVFIEASVVLDDALAIKAKKPKGLLVAPSCTFVFHPIIKHVIEIIESGKYGKVCNFSHHYGQFLPDWHAWEDVNDYYVSRRVAGAARESLTFELTWIVRMFGFPKEIKGFFMKTADIGCDIEDTYTGTMRFEDCLGNILIDVVARTATRNLVINLERAQLQWRVDQRRLEIYEAEKKEWKYIDEDPRIVVEGYSSNIGENMYIDELDTFLKAVDGKTVFPNTMDEDIRVLNLLKAVEDSDGGYYRE